MLCLVTQSCLSRWDSLDHSPPGSSVHGISQARILEWLSFSLPGDLPKPNVWASQIAQQVKNLPAIQETQEMRVWFQGEEDPLEEEMATHSSIPAWEIPWTKKPRGLWYKTLRHNWLTKYTALIPYFIYMPKNVVLCIMSPSWNF